VTVSESLHLGDVRAPIDRQQLTHAIMNVLLNAIQAMPSGGTLTIRADVVTPPDGSRATVSRVARIAVSDTGPGIPKEYMDRIFEPYFTTKEGGTGLGLALAHRVVVEHRGTIRAENASGGGARFVIELPCA
jgi:signal transduction histidine kinase